MSKNVNVELYSMFFSNILCKISSDKMFLFGSLYYKLKTLMNCYCVIYCYFLGNVSFLILRYRAKKNKWNSCRAKLKKGRRRHAMVSCGNKIYAIGGFNSELEEGCRVQNSIEEYELDSGITIGDSDTCKIFYVGYILGFFRGKKTIPSETAFLGVFLKALSHDK